MSPNEAKTTIRAALPADMPAVARLAAKLVRQHHAMDPKRFMTFEPIEPGYERYLTSETKTDEAVVLAAIQVSEGHESVVGYAYGRLEPKDWNALREACGALHDIYVDESVRGQGVATLLLGEMVKRLREKGAPRVVLMTATANATALRLFERFGFRRTMVEMTVET